MATSTPSSPNRMAIARPMPELPPVTTATLALQTGVRAVGSTTVTSGLHGCLRHDPAARAEFFALAGVAA